MQITPKTIATNAPGAICCSCANNGDKGLVHFSLLQEHPKYLSEIEYLEAVILAGRQNLARYQNKVNLTQARLAALKNQ